MRVVVTGGTGFVGSHIVSELSRRGHEVALASRNPGDSSFPSFRFDLNELLRPEGSTAMSEGLARCDVLVHNAILWEEEPTEIELKDVRASAALFQLAVDAGVGRIVYTSSTAVHRPFAARMDESAHLAPIDLYGATKAATEALLPAICHGSPTCWNIVRPGPVVGDTAYPGGPLKSDRRLEAIVRAARDGAPIEVVRNDGRQFVGAADLAKLYGHVPVSPHDGEVVIACSDQFTTWEAVARLAIERANSRSEVVVRDEGLPRPPFAFDVGKLNRLFGTRFKADLPLQDHIDALLVRI